MRDCMSGTWDVDRVPGKFISGAGGPNEFQQSFLILQNEMLRCDHHRQFYKLLNHDEEQLAIFSFSSYLRLGAFVELCSQQSQRMT